ncbi:MAG: (Fe-S)-binding protein [Alphaproteobacteria bacterium]
MTDSDIASFASALDERVAEITERCSQCGKCFEACPMTAPAGIAEADPREVLGGVIDLLKGGDGNATARRWAEVCTNSGFCIPACDDGVNARFMMGMTKLAAKRREHDSETLERKATASFRAMTRGVRMLSRLQLPPETLARVNPRPSRTAPETPPEVVFYTGCNILKTPHIALLCLDILDRLGVSYEVKGGTSTCCGIFQFNAGDAETSGRVAFNSIDQLASAGAAEVLSWCPSCQTQMSEITLPAFQRVRKASPFELTPFLVYLARNVDRLRPLMTHRVEKRVALNERPAVPAAMTAAKTLLAAIPGLEFVELDVRRIGNMSNYLSVLPNFKTELRAEEFQAASAAGVTTLATVYHACHRELCHYDKDVSFEIVNFMELLGESMGLHSPDIYKRLKIMQDVDAVIADADDLVTRHGLDLEDLRAVLYVDMLGGPPPAATATSGSRSRPSA